MIDDLDVLEDHMREGIIRALPINERLWIFKDFTERMSIACDELIGKNKE